MSALKTVDSSLKKAVVSLQRDWKSVTSAYENFAGKKIKFAQKVNEIWLQAQELDGSSDGENINFFREQCQVMIQSTNKTILSKWITIGENADILLPHVKSLPSQRDSLYAISVEASRLKNKNVIETWIKNGQITTDSTVREVDALRVTTKKKHTGTSARFVTVTLYIDSTYQDSFNLLKSVIQSDKVKKVQSEKSLKSVAINSLDEDAFNKISYKFK